MAGINTPNGSPDVPDITPPKDLDELVNSMETAEGRQRSTLETRALTGTHEPWKKADERLAQDPHADIVQQRWGDKDEIEARVKRLSDKIRNIELEQREVDGKQVYFIKSLAFKKAMEDGRAVFELENPNQHLDLVELYDGVIANHDRLRVLELIDRLSAETDEKKQRELHIEINGLRDIIGEREMLTGMVGHYASSIETYERVRNDVRGANPDLNLPDDSTAMQHHAVFRHLVTQRLTNGIRYEQLVGRMNEVKTRYRAAKKNRGPNHEITRGLRDEFAKLNEGYDELYDQGQTIDQQIVELLQGKQGPGANEQGLLPVQKVTLEVIDAEYEAIHQAYQEFERIGTQIRQGKASNQDVSELERLFKQRKTVFDTLDRRGKANVRRKTDVMVMIGRFNIYRAKAAMLRHSSAVADKSVLPEGKTFEDLPLSKQQRYRDVFLSENARQSIGDIKNHLSAMIEAVPPVSGNGIDGEDGKPNANAFVDDIADRIARLQGAYSPSGVGMLDAAITTFKGDSRDALYTALDWPRDSQTGKPLTLEQMERSDDPRVKGYPEKLKLKSQTMKQVVEQFRNSQAIVNLSDSVAVCETLLEDEWRPENCAEFEQLDFRDFPPPGTRVTKRNMNELAEKHGKQVVYMLAMEQLSTDWERYGLEHDRLMTGMHSIIDVHYEFAAAEEVFRAKAKEVEGIIQVMGMFGTGAAVWAGLRYGGAYVRGGLPRLGSRLAKDGGGLVKGARAVPRYATGAGRGVYRIGQRGLAAMRPSGAPMVPARVLAQSRTVTSAIAKFGVTDAKFLRLMLRNPQALAKASSAANAARVARLRTAIKTANLTRREAYALQRALNTAAKEANGAVKLGSAEAALFKASGGVAREMSFLTASGRVLGVAAMAFQAYMVYDAFEQYGDANERATKTKDDMIKQLTDSGFEDNDNDGIYRHPDMPGVEVNVSMINEGLDAEQNARLADAITAAGGLAAAAAITCLATGPASVVLIIGVVVIEIVVHAIIEHYEFKKQKELLAGEHPLPPWLLLAFGTMRTTNKTPNTILDKLDLDYDAEGNDGKIDHKVAERIVWLQWCQEAQNGSDELFSQIFCDKQQWHEVDEFYEEEWSGDNGMYAVWRKLLYEETGGPKRRKEYGAWIERVKDNPDFNEEYLRKHMPSKDNIGFLFKSSTPLQRRKVMRTTMAAYLPYIKAKRYLKMKEKYDDNPMGKATFGENELHLETVIELFAEEKILGKKVKDFKKDDLEKIAKNPAAVLDMVDDTRDLYRFVDNPVIRMQLKDVYETDEDSDDFRALNERTDIIYAVNSLVHETKGIPDFGRGMSIWQHAVTVENAGGVYEDDPVRKGEIRLTDFAGKHLTWRSKSRDDDLAQRLFGEGNDFDASLAPLVLQHVRFGGEVINAETKEVTDKGPSEERAKKWHLDITRSMLEAVRRDYPEFGQDNLEAVILTGEPYAEEKRRHDPSLFSNDKENYTQYNYAGHVRLLFRNGDETFALDQGFVAYRNRGVHHSERKRTDWSECHIVKGALRARSYTEARLDDIDTHLSRKVTDDLIVGSNQRYGDIEYDSDHPENFTRRPELENMVLEDIREPPLLLISEADDVLKEGSGTRDAAIELCKRLAGDGRSGWSASGAVCIELARRDDGAVTALATYLGDDTEGGGSGVMISRSGAVAEPLEDEKNPWYFIEGSVSGRVRRGDDVDRSMWLKDAESLRARYGAFDILVSSLEDEHDRSLNERFNGVIAHVLAENAFLSADEIPRGTFGYVRATNEHLLMVDDSQRVIFRSREALYDPREKRYGVTLKCDYDGRTFYRSTDVHMAKIPAEGGKFEEKDRKRIDAMKTDLLRKYPGADIQETFVEHSPRSEFDRFVIDSDNMVDGFNPVVDVRTARELMSRQDLSRKERRAIVELYVTPLSTPQETIARIVDLFPSSVRADGTSARDVLIKRLSVKMADVNDPKPYLRSLFYDLLDRGWISDESVENIDAAFGSTAMMTQPSFDNEIPLPDGYKLIFYDMSEFQLSTPDGGMMVNGQDGVSITVRREGKPLAGDRSGRFDEEDIIAGAREGTLTVSVTGPGGKKLLTDYAYTFAPDVFTQRLMADDRLVQTARNEWVMNRGDGFGFDEYVIKQSVAAHSKDWLREGKYTSGYSYASTFRIEDMQSGIRPDIFSFQYFDQMRASLPLEALERAIDGLPDADVKRKLRSGMVVLTQFEQSLSSGETTEVPVSVWRELNAMSARDDISNEVRLLLSEVLDELSGISRRLLIRNLFTTPEAGDHEPGTAAFERPVRRIMNMFLWNVYHGDRERNIAMICAMMHKNPDKKQALLGDMLDALAKASKRELKEREAKAIEAGDRLTRREREVGVIDAKGIDAVFTALKEKYGPVGDAFEEYQALLSNNGEVRRKIAWIRPVRDARRERHFQTLDALPPEENVPGEPGESDDSFSRSYYARFDSELGFIVIPKQSTEEVVGKERFKPKAEGLHMPDKNKLFTYGRVTTTHMVREGIAWNEVHSFGFVTGESALAKQARFALTTPMPPESSPESHVESINRIIDLCPFRVAHDERGRLVDYKSELIGSVNDPRSLSALYIKAHDKQKFLAALVDTIKETAGENDYVIDGETVPLILTEMRERMRDDAFVTVLKTDVPSEMISLPQGYYVQAEPHTIRNQKGIRIKLMRKDGKPVEGELIVGSTTAYRYRDVLEQPDQSWLSMDDYKDYGMHLTVKLKDDAVLLDRMPVVVEGSEEARASYKAESFKKRFMASAETLVTESRKLDPDMNNVRKLIEELNDDVSIVEFADDNEHQRFTSLFAPREDQRYLSVGMRNEAAIRLSEDGDRLELLSVPSLKTTVARLRSRLTSGPVESDEAKAIIASMNEAVSDMERMFAPERFEPSAEVAAQEAVGEGHFLRFNETTRRFSLAYAPFEKLPSLPETLSSSFSLKPKQVVEIAYTDENGKTETVGITAEQQNEGDPVTLAYDKAACERLGVTIVAGAASTESVRLRCTVDATKAGSFRVSSREKADAPVTASAEFLTRLQRDEIDFARDEQGKWVGSGGDTFHLCHKDASGNFAYYRWNVKWGDIEGRKPERLLAGSLSWKEAPTDELPELPTLPQ